MADLFEGLRQGKRERLRGLGWREAENLVGGCRFWLRPDGAVFTEDEAFRQLERQDMADGGAHG